MTADETVMDAFRKTAQAASEGKIAHFTVAADRSPDQLGVVVCFVTCPDEFVRQLQHTFDGVVEEFMWKVVGSKRQQ